MVSIGAIYNLLPVVLGKKQGEMYSTNLINVHFWLATIGTVLYIAAMWVNGILQGLMWRAVNEDGTLTYSIVVALEASHMGYFVRALGGAFWVASMLLMAYNVWQTVRKDSTAPVADASAQAA